MAESVDTKYENLSQREHILKRMNLYLGSKNETENTVWVVNKETEKLEKETISYSIALINSLPLLVKSIVRCIILQETMNTIVVYLKTPIFS